MAISAAELNIILSAKDKEFKKAMAANERRVQRFSKNSQKNLSSVAKSFDRVGSAAKKLVPILAAAFAVKGVINIVNSAVELGNFAAVAGVSVERFQELAFAGAAFGVSQEKMADILKDVNDKFGDYAETGAGPLADFFDNIAPKVGLTAAAFADFSSDQKMGAYVTALESANLSQDKMTFYMEALASDSVLLQRAFANNGAEVERLSKKLKDAGGVISSEAVAKSKAFKEELDLVSTVIKNNLMAALETAMPMIKLLAENFDAATSAAGRFMFGQTQDMSKLGLLASIRTKELEAAGHAWDEWKARALMARGAVLEGNDKKTAASFGMSRSVYADAMLEDAQANQAVLQLQIDGMKSLLDHMASNADTAVTKPPRGNGGRSSAAAAAAALEREAALRAGNITLLEAYTQAVIDGETAAAEMAAVTAGRLIAVQEAYDNVRSSLDPLRDATLAYADSIQAVNDALAQGLISEDQAAKDREKITANFQAVKDGASGLTESMAAVDDAFATAFGDIISGTSSVGDAFKRMAASIITDLIRIQTQQASGGSGLLGGLLKAGSGLLSGLMGGGAFPTSTPGGAADLLQPNAPGRAMGGPMAAGSPAVVGEHGREIFVPSSAGRMLSVPQSKAAVNGGGGATVNQTINVTTGIQQTVRAEIQSLMPQIAAASTQAVLNARRRGGSFARSFS